MSKYAFIFLVYNNKHPLNFSQKGEQASMTSKKRRGKFCSRKATSFQKLGFSVTGLVQSTFSIQKIQGILWGRKRSNCMGSIP